MSIESQVKKSVKNAAVALGLKKKPRKRRAKSGRKRGKGGRFR